MAPANKAFSIPLNNRVILPPAPLPAFFDETLDALPLSPSPNTSINQTNLDLLAAIQNEAVSSTPSAGNHDNPTNLLTTTNADLSFAAQPQSLIDRLLEAEERGASFGGNNPAIRDPLNKYTKGPMPLIHYAHPTAIFDHLDVNLVRNWVNLPKGKLLAQPFGADARTLSMHPQLKSLLFAAIIDITNSHDISVSAPRPKPITYRTPFSFLIYNVSDEHAQTLLKRKVWSSVAITFSVSTLNPSCPDYLFTIKGLTTMLHTEVHNTVNEVWHDQTSLTFLDSLCRNFPENFQTQAINTLQQFVNSLEVVRLDTRLRGNIINPVYNIYAKGGLIGNDHMWSRIRAFYASRTYAPQAQDPGTTVIAPFRCSICHAVDHPRGLCPFPVVEGWNGPKRREETGVAGPQGGAGPN